MCYPWAVMVRPHAGLNRIDLGLFFTVHYEDLSMLGSIAF